MVVVVALALCRLDGVIGGSLDSLAGCFHPPFDFSPSVSAKTRCCCSTGPTARSRDYNWRESSKLAIVR